MITARKITMARMMMKFGFKYGTIMRRTGIRGPAFACFLNYTDGLTSKQAAERCNQAAGFSSAIEFGRVFRGMRR